MLPFLAPCLTFVQISQAREREQEQKKRTGINAESVGEKFQTQRKEHSVAIKRAV